MDSARFDRLAKLFGGSSSRRALLRGVIGAAGAATISSLDMATSRAARRGPAPTPTTATGDPCTGISCGPACCEPGVSVCCDGACCAGQCYGEELCCPAGSLVCEGVCCDPGEFCIDGTCNSCAGCWIDDACYANLERNPENLCQQCEIGSSTSAWTDIVLSCLAIVSACTAQSGVCDPATGECGAPYAVNEGGACSGLSGSGTCKNANGLCSQGTCVYGPDSDLDGQPCGFDLGDPCNANLCLDGECVKTPVHDGDNCGISTVCSPHVCSDGACVVSTVPTDGKTCLPPDGCTVYTCDAGDCVAGEKDCGIDMWGRQGHCIPGGCEWSGGKAGDDCSAGSPECGDGLICASTSPCLPMNVNFQCYRPGDVPTCGF